MLALFISSSSLRSMKGSHRVSSNRPDAVERRIRDVLAALKPLLHIETARIELVEFQRSVGVAVVRLAGDCPDCDLTAAMLRQGIEAHLRAQIPEIREVRTI